MECIVRGCLFSYGRPYSNVLMYEFPRDHNLRKLWLKALHMNEFELKDHWKICEHHFSIYDYNADGSLKYNAVPWVDIRNYSEDKMDIEELEMSQISIERHVEMPIRQFSREQISETTRTKDINIEEDLAVMQKEKEVVVTLDMKKTNTVSGKQLTSTQSRTLKKNQREGRINKIPKPRKNIEEKEELKKLLNRTEKQIRQMLKDLLSQDKRIRETNPSSSTVTSKASKSSTSTEKSVKPINNPAQQSERMKKGIDHYAITSFGKFVSSRLRSFRNDEIRKKAQHEIMQVIINYEEKDIANSTD